MTIIEFGVIGLLLLVIVLSIASFLMPFAAIWAFASGRANLGIIFVSIFIVTLVVSMWTNKRRKKIKTIRPVKKK